MTLHDDFACFRPFGLGADIHRDALFAAHDWYFGPQFKPSAPMQPILIGIADSEDWHREEFPRPFLTECALYGWVRARSIVARFHVITRQRRLDDRARRLMANALTNMAAPP